MELYIALRKAYDSFGKEILLADKQLLNILADLHAFDSKATKVVFRNLLQSGYGRTLYDTLSENSPTQVMLCKSIANDLIKNYGFQEKAVTYVVDSIAFSLNWADSVPEYLESDSFETLESKMTFQTGGVSFSLLLVEGGTFTIGATPEQGMLAAFDEKPALEIRVNDYYLGEMLVTQELWEAVMGNNPSHFTGRKLPVERVSWDDCMSFVAKLSSLLNVSFRLPTEAEWEYAARGGNKTSRYQCSGSMLGNLSEVAWYKENSGNTTHEVGSLKPNELGLYDMNGNVSEWCSDWYSASYANSSQRENPTGPTMGVNRVHRGGSWNDKAQVCRVSKRSSLNPNYTNKLVGLRLAASKL